MSSDKSASPFCFFFFLAVAWGGAFLSFNFWSWARFSACARKPSSRPSGRGAVGCFDTKWSFKFWSVGMRVLQMEQSRLRAFSPQPSCVPDFFMAACFLALRSWDAALAAPRTIFTTVEDLYVCRVM
ncbi:unnamed protein product [Pelagomonas calceolata]|uniref:Uncharacterized protein n=1 Tax=Pelagomonas calceolata TaxID=35677 RepID=A0A8J2SRM5_9STRA|nr:unnamed protein product [Pelagomonas calceolata]